MKPVEVLGEVVEAEFLFFLGICVSLCVRVCRGVELVRTEGWRRTSSGRSSLSTWRALIGMVASYVWGNSTDNSLFFCGVRGDGGRGDRQTDREVYVCVGLKKNQCGKAQ